MISISLTPSITQDATYLVIFVSVESNECLGPEGVYTECAEHNVSVIGFMIVSDPASNKSPEGLDAWVGAPSGCLFRLTTYEK